MRVLKYELSNGKVVSSLQEAEMSSLKFKSVLENVKTTKVQRSPLAQEMIEKYLETGKERKFEEAVNAAIAKYYSEYSEYLEKYA